MKFSFILSILLSCASITSAQTLADSTLIPVDSTVKVGKLENGLTYYLKNNNWPEHRACFYLVQRVGSMQEENNQRGLAHFLEHMCFNGSEHFEGNAIEHYCESLGVDDGGGVNAYTSFEETVYNIDDVPTSVGQERLDSCLLILYDWANSLSLDSLEIEKERGVIHEEWRMGRDATERILDRQLPVLYPNCKYGVRMPIGLMDIVDNFSHQQLKDYYEKWYNPENQCVIVVGDIDLQHTEDMIYKLFGDIVSSSNAGIVTSELVNDHEGIVYSIDKDTELQDNYVQLIFKHKAYTPDERKRIAYWKDNYKTNAALSMLNVRYGDAALFPDCPYLTASADDDSYIYASTKAAFQLSATTKDGNQAKALSSMLTECRRASKYGFTKEEYDRYLSEQVSSLDNLLLTADKRKNRSLVKEYYNNYLYGYDMSSIEDYVKIQKDIALSTTLDEVNQRMQELLPDENENMVIVNWNIEKEGQVYPSEEELYMALQNGRNASISPYVDKLRNVKLIKKKPHKGSIVKEEYNDIIGYTKLTLSNGATVLLKHTDIEQSQILFKAYGEGGWSLYNQDEDPNINIFNSITFGDNDLSVSDVNKLLSGKRVNLSHSLGMRQFTFTGSSNPKDIETLLEMVHADFTCPANDLDEYRNMIDQTRISLNSRKTVPEEAFSDSVSVVSCGHHPRFKLLEEEDLDKVDIQKELFMFKEQTSNARGYTFIFVGNIDTLTIRPLIEKYLASLPSKRQIKKGAFIKTWLDHDVSCHFTRQMETPKSIVHMEWFSESFPYTLENKIIADATCRVLNMVYSKIIREENSAAYDCSADYYLLRGDSDECQLGFSADCSMMPEKCDSVLKLMQMEYSKMSSYIDNSMFLNAKESMLKSFDELTATKNGFWIDAIWQNERYGFNTFTNRRKLIENLSLSQVTDFMKTMQSHSHKCEILMQPIQ